MSSTLKTLRMIKLIDTQCYQEPCFEGIFFNCRYTCIAIHQKYSSVYFFHISTGLFTLLIEDMGK